MVNRRSSVLIGIISLALLFLLKPSITLRRSSVFSCFDKAIELSSTDSGESFSSKKSIVLSLYWFLPSISVNISCGLISFSESTEDEMSETLVLLIN